MQGLKSVHSPRLLVGCFFAAAAASLPAWSQVATADILGAVTDSSAALVGAGLHGAASALARGWQFNAIALMQSGGTLTIQNSSARANRGSGDRANLIGDPYAISQSPAHWFNTAAFASQRLDSGTVGRNTMYGSPMKVSRCT
jgi:hypothetical protein